MHSFAQTHTHTRTQINTISTASSELNLGQPVSIYSTPQLTKTLHTIILTY